MGYFDKPTLSTHNPDYQSINVDKPGLSKAMSHLFDKPTLSVNKPGLSNSIMWVSAINLLFRQIMWYFRETYIIKVIK